MAISGIIYQIATSLHYETDWDYVNWARLFLISSGSDSCCSNFNRFLQGQDLAGVLPASLAKLPYLKIMYWKHPEQLLEN